MIQTIYKVKKDGNVSYGTFNGHHYISHNWTQPTYTVEITRVDHTGRKDFNHKTTYGIPWHRLSRTAKYYELKQNPIEVEL